MQTSSKDYAGMWHLVGVGSRIAVELGLHCETAYPYKRSDDSTRDVVVHQEVSRLCFWSIIAMDRYAWQLQREEIWKTHLTTL